MLNNRVVIAMAAILASVLLGACEEDDTREDLGTTATDTNSGTTTTKQQTSSSDTMTHHSTASTTGLPTDDTSTNGQAELQAALDGLVAAEVTEQKILAMAMTVELVDGQRLHAASGRIGPSTDDALYTHDQTKQVIGSITKMYTAAMILQLVEEKRLSLDDSIVAWVSVPKAESITVRMLLNHTSGLNDYLSVMMPEELARPWEPAALVDIAVKAGARTEPGAPLAWYSNTNFIILGILLEKVTGQSWADNLSSRITSRLGLSHTFYAGQAEGAKGLVEGWSFEEGMWKSTSAVVHPSVGWAAGAIVSTNAEVAIFMHALLSGGLFAEKATLAAMLSFDMEMDPATQASGEPPQRVGLGVTRYDIDEVQLVGHMGHIYGYDASAFRDPATGAIFTASANSEQAVTAWSVYKAALFLRDNLR